MRTSQKHCTGAPGPTRGPDKTCTSSDQLMACTSHAAAHLAAELSSCSSPAGSMCPTWGDSPAGGRAGSCGPQPHEPGQPLPHAAAPPPHQQRPGPLPGTQRHQGPSSWSQPAPPTASGVQLLCQEHNHVPACDSWESGVKQCTEVGSKLQHVTSDAQLQAHLTV